MGDFLQNNWFWIVVFVFFIWMHSSRMGCGGIVDMAGTVGDKKKGEEDKGHQH